MGKNGKNTAVGRDIRVYRGLLQHIEDLEDALESDNAVRTAKSFRPYEDIRRELKNTGRL